jgi:GntR family transcriptional regulator
MISTSQKQLADHRLPLYQQLRDLFIQKIQQGIWSDSHAIPSELDLAHEHAVAPGTVRKAIESLVSDGYLTRKQGSGTFVRRANFGNALFRFFRHTDETGNVLEPRSKILSLRGDQASPAEVEKLKLRASADQAARPTRLADQAKSLPDVIRIQRIRQVSDEPLVYEEITVCAQKFHRLLVTDPTTFGDLLYPFYDTLCEVKVQNATETVSFSVAKPEVAKQLRTKTNAPVAIIERLAFDIHGHPVEWRISYGLASKFNYSVELK